MPSSSPPTTAILPLRRSCYARTTSAMGWRSLILLIALLCASCEPINSAPVERVSFMAVEMVPVGGEQALVGFVPFDGAAASIQAAATTHGYVRGQEIRAAFARRTLYLDQEPPPP